MSDEANSLIVNMRQFESLRYAPCLPLGAQRITKHESADRESVEVAVRRKGFAIELVLNAG